MKKLLVVFLSTLSFLINAQSDPNLKWLHPSPQGWDLRWVKMWDASNWYLCGDYGSFLKTTDAGQTWTTKNNAGWPNPSYPEIHTNWHANEAWFFDQNNGIVVGSNTAGILKTTDGGETFDTLSILSGTNSGKNIYSIYFVNSNLGFISGNTAYKVHQTTDGGNSWTQLSNLPDGTYNDVYASDALNIITCSTLGLIYKTTDGGNNWTPIQVPTLQTLYDIEFTSPTNGYVCGGAGFFKMTTDGGATWTGGTNTPAGMTNYKIKVINNEVYVAGNDTMIFKTTDNGSSWTNLQMTTDGSMIGASYCMDVVGANIVVAGIRGYIYKSVNSGSDWDVLLDRETDGSFFRSFYVENSTGKIIVAGRWADAIGTIIISDDGGENWYASSQTIPFDNRLLRMQMVNGSVGYFGGEYGYFAKTTDGAMSLTQIVMPFDPLNFYYNMEFFDQSTGWVVGGIPTPILTPLVAKTTDGGLTWINQTPAGIPGPIITVDFVDQNIGYMSGQNMYKTTNGGTNWTQVSLPGLSGTINSLKAFDANNIYISTSTAEFYKTTNGGINWQSVTTVPWGGALGFGQAWYDLYNGIQFGVLGAIAKTSDAGHTWETMNTGGWTVAGGIMIHPDTFYVGSSDKGQIFRYAKPSTQTNFQLTVDINNGWNMVSTPGLHPVDQNVTTWWSGKDPTAGVFRFSGGYLPVITTTPGQGYWMKHVGVNTYNTGSEWPASGIIPVVNTPIAGSTGWNLIGGYELNVLTSGITTSPAGLQTGSVFQYGTGYTVATNLVPGYGYWIKLTGAGSINIPTSLAKGLAKTTEVNTSDWGKIIITDKSGKSYTLYSVKGKVNLNDYELPPSPPDGMFDIRYGSGRYAEELTGIKTIFMQGLEYPIKVHVEGAEIKLHNESGEVINTILKSGEDVTIIDAKVSKLLVSGTTIPDKYSLEQNYPNPFNPSTNIKFSLPEATEVTVTIYNTLGQRITELVNGKLEAGKYSYIWNANSVATGMYIYELRTDKFVSVKKMLLLK